MVTHMFRRTARSVRVLFLSSTMALSSVAVAQACAFDMVKPERTIIDWIVETDQLVLARPQTDNAFLFETVDVLIGEERTDAIDTLVDTNTRRKLAMNPNDAVLFAQDQSGEWHRVTYVNDTFQGVLDTALQNRTDWRGSIPASRLAFIEGLQDSEDPVQTALLIGELDKVPYDQLRQLNLRLSTDTLLDELWTTAGYPYQAIRALLLGLSDDEEARQEIAAYIERVTPWDWANNLGAFAAALIEIDGINGVNALAEGMLQDPNQPLDKIEQVIMALSVQHNVATPEVQNAIAQAIRDLVDLRPETAAPIARQFTLRSNWSQSAVLEPLVRDRRFSTLGELLTVSVYLASAREQAAQKNGIGE